MDKHQLNPMLREDLPKLLERTQHSLCLDDFADIASLNKLAWLVSCPTDTDTDAFFSRGVPLGDQWLNPITIGKEHWYRNYALKWWSEDDPDMAVVLAYILASENTEEALSKLDNQTDAKRSVSAWHRQLKVTSEDLIGALNRLLPASGKEGGSVPSSIDYGPVIALLVKEYGSTPDYWMYEAPIDVCSAMLDDYQVRMQAEWEASRKKSGGKPSPLPATPKLIAQTHYRDARNKLEEKWAKLI